MYRLALVIGKSFYAILARFLLAGSARVIKGLRGAGCIRNQGAEEDRRLSPALAREFEEHRYRMLYAMFPAQGYPIGSGTIESGVKQYKHRLAGPDMRWSRPGAERIMPIRSAVLYHAFDRLWQPA